MILCPPQALRSALACLALAVFLALPAWSDDGLTLTMNVSAKGGKTTTVTSYYADEKARNSDGQVDTIVDYASGTWTVVEHKKEKFWTTTEEETSAYYAKLNSDMDGNPVLSRMVGDIGEVRSESTGRTREIAGYRCEEWVITAGEKYRIEAWVTEDIPMPLTYRDVRRVSTAMMGPMAGPFEALWKALAELPGMPLATTTVVKVMGMTVDATSEATKVEQGPVPADAFEVPAKYKQKKSPFAG